MTNPLLEAALKYARRGKPVFPCNPKNKRPLTDSGFKDATTNAYVIADWWKDNPEAMIGFPTGHISGVAVIDCDGDIGIDNFEKLCLNALYDPYQTLWQSTPSGGRHFFFAMPDYDIRNSASRLARNVDVRGNGGYVIVAPSIREDSKAYQWQKLCDPLPLPGWLLDLMLNGKPDNPGVAKNTHETAHNGPAIESKYALAALQGECEKVRAAGQGERNQTLNQAAFALGTLCGAGELPKERVESELLNAAIACGLPQDEAIRTIKSGLDKGVMNPRRIERTPRQVESQEQESGEDEQQEFILPKPPAVPLAAFPPEIANLIEETASAFFVPKEIPASVMLALVSALVGRARSISQKTTWQDYGNIWLAIVGKSASGKSPVMRELYRPLKRLEAKAQKQFELEYENYEDDLNEWKSQKRKQEGKLSFPMAKPVPPTLQQCLVDDITLESLANALRDNPKGLQWQRDELSGLLFDMDRYTKNGGGTKARLLSAYDCDSWKTSRSSNSGRNIFIPHACISIFGGIQPGMLGKAFEAGNNGSDIESGFLQRFIFIRSEQDQPERWNDNTLSDYSKKLLEQITGHLWQWDIALDDEGNEKSPIVPVSQEAHAIYKQWFNEVSREAFISENSPLLKKLRSKVQRLCLLLHCMDAAIAGNDGMNPITADCM